MGKEDMTLSSLTRRVERRTLHLRRVDERYPHSPTLLLERGFLLDQAKQSDGSAPVLSSGTSQEQDVLPHFCQRRNRRG